MLSENTNTGSGAYAVLAVKNDTVNLSGLLKTSAANTAYTGIGSSLLVYQEGGKPIGFVTSNLQRMIIDSTGNVGIGTTVPSSTLHVIGSMQVGSPTGGDKGAGSINAQAVYDDNTLLTDWVFDDYYDGQVREEDLELHGDHHMMTIEEMIAFAQENRHLPTITGRQEWNEQGGLSLGKLASQLWETAEKNALYIGELNSRLKTLEALDSSQAQNDGGAQLQGSFQGSDQIGADTQLTLKTLAVNENLTVKGFAIFNEDTIGQAEIQAEESIVHVSFAQEYKTKPIITVTPEGESALALDFRYAVTNVTATGFDIKMSVPATDAMLFNWHAFAVPEGAKLFVSDGSRRDITLTVIAPEVEEVINVPTSEPVAPPNATEPPAPADTQNDSSSGGEESAPANSAVAEDTTDSDSSAGEAAPPEEGDSAPVEEPADEVAVVPEPESSPAQEPAPASEPASEPVPAP